VYDHGPVYLTGAYELHKKVNRTSDLADLDPNDVVDEQAWKLGGQFRVAKATTIDANLRKTSHASIRSICSSRTSGPATASGSR